MREEKTSGEHSSAGSITSNACANSGSQGESTFPLDSRQSRLSSFIRFVSRLWRKRPFQISVDAAKRALVKDGARSYIARYVNAASHQFHLIFTKLRRYNEKDARMAMNDRPTARILLAEDDNDMRRFLVKALQQAGFSVTSFDNGLSAYDQLRVEPFELLLTDIVMPEMDGIELARRATELDPDIKVMFITGFAAVALNPDNHAPRQAKILSKPFHLRDLVTEVRGCWRPDSPRYPQASQMAATWRSSAPQQPPKIRSDGYASRRPR